MGHIKRAIAASRNEAANESRRPTSTPSAGERRAYGQGAIVSYIMALETAALIAFAITLHLAKRHELGKSAQRAEGRTQTRNRRSLHAVAPLPQQPKNLAPPTRTNKTVCSLAFVRYIGRAISSFRNNIARASLRLQIGSADVLANNANAHYLNARQKAKQRNRARPAGNSFSSKKEAIAHITAMKLTNETIKPK